MNMQFKAPITVLAARRYSLTAKDTGELITGCQVTYVADWAGEQQQNRSGVELMTSTMPYEAFGQFAILPAMYDASFSMVAGAKGKPTLRIDAVEYMQPFGPSIAGKKPKAE